MLHLLVFSQIAVAEFMDLTEINLNFSQTKSIYRKKKSIFSIMTCECQDCHEKFTVKNFAFLLLCHLLSTLLSCLLLCSSSSPLFLQQKRLLIEHPALSFKLQGAYTMHLKGVKMLKIPGGVWKCPPHCPWLQRLDVLRITTKRPLIDSWRFASAQMLFG